MKRMQRIMALLLCVSMMVPMQGMTALADMEARIEETLPLEMVETTEEIEITEEIEETEHIQETLPLEPLEEETVPLTESRVIYWNPGGSLPLELTATPSDANEMATSSNARLGNDRADGLTAERPVKTLETALILAEDLADQQGIDKSEITIYAMNPMEVVDGRMYILNAGNIRIASWPGRTYHNDTIFYLDGGQMTLMNTVLESGVEGAGSEQTELIRVCGGSLQLGNRVTIDGRIVMDYRDQKETEEWKQTTASDMEPLATASSWTEEGDRGGSFDVDNYILNKEPDQWELLEDKHQVSTWREPIIELIDGFEGTEEGYLLDIRSDDKRNTIPLAKTLYADQVNEADFTEYFRLADTDIGEWSLISTTEEKAIVRDTGAENLQRYYQHTSIDTPQEMDEVPAMTTKTLAATSSLVERRIYWNPGPKFTYGSEEYPAGSDSVQDGTQPIAPVKTLEKALAVANGAPIIVMQTLDLSAPDAGEYLTTKEGAAWYVAGETEGKPMAIAPTLKAWEVTQNPFFRVGVGQTLILKNIELEGISKGGALVDVQMIVVSGGDLIVRNDVTVKSGYIQINATPDLVNHPVRADGINNVDVTLFFSGINTNLEYRYTDVVVPTKNILPDGSTEEQQEAIGQTLAGIYQLARANRSAENGGTSQFDWRFRQDQLGDDLVKTPQNLELYAEHFYNAIYLDGKGGTDTALGVICEYPVRTWERAKQIWDEQMAVSLAARTNAHTANPEITKAEMDKRYPYTDVIYICGTVPIIDAKIWELSTRIDYDGSVIVTEVASHTSNYTEGGSAIHELPTCLAEVTSGGALTVKDVKFRNGTDLPDSQTILVDGGALTLEGTTTMSGLRKAGLGVDKKEITRGTHVAAKNGAVVHLLGSWTGSIEGRQQGLTAQGATTRVTMDGGSIQRNDTYDSTVSTSLQKKGAGIALSDGAQFVMNGGTISENKTYTHGGGVYVAGKDTTFTMNAGTVMKNSISRAGTSFNTTVYGIGIYGDTNTILNIGTDSTRQGTVKVSENSAYLVYGCGIYSNGILNLKNAEISDNTGDSSLGGNYTSYSERYVGRGMGIHVGSQGVISMESTKVFGNKVSAPKDHYEYGYGAGIYVESTKNNVITNSELSGNMFGRAFSITYSKGGAIYLNGTLDISDTTIAGNRATVGGGIYTATGYTRLTISNSTISGNITSNSATASATPFVSGNGGGLCLDKGITTITDCRLENNQASSGGGLYVGAYTLNLRGSTVNSLTITGNTGGGIYQADSVISGENVLISQNTGSGVTVEGSSSRTYFRTVEISNNTASSGAGVSCGSVYDYPILSFEDVKVENNISSESGGGVYLNGHLYWSERTPGASTLSGNSAKEGGGIFGGTYAGGVLDFSGEIQNSATEQGSNLYLYSGNVNIMQGSYKQPVTQTAGIYNAYLAISNGINGLGLDPQKVQIEKKIGANPDAVYLHTGSSFLRYFQSPQADARAEMPIDVNKEAFTVGSTVIKPANIASLDSYRPKATLSDAEIYPIIFPAKLENASINAEYSKDGTLPRRMQLGGYQDESNSSLTNVVLVGEGVYLAGVAAGGSDENNGFSPDQAVASFSVAKGILENEIQTRKLIDDALADGEKMGFSPYIYICGTVPITKDEAWELDYKSDLYTITNQAYRDAEKRKNPELLEDLLQAQVRRFASFLTTPMIMLGSGSDAPTLQLDKIIIDGMAEAVVASTQEEKSPVIEGRASTTLLINGEAQIRNNYGNGIRTEGNVILDGAEMEENKQLKDIEGKAIHLKAKANLEMKGYARIVSDGRRMSETVPSRYGVCTDTITAPAEASITMKGHSAIEKTGKIALHTGIYATGNVDVQLQNFARIKDVTYGVELYDAGKQFAMNCNTDASEDDSAQIIGGKYGIYIGGSGWGISMDKKSQMQGSSSSGVYVNADNTTVPTTLEMLGNSVIANNASYGIYIYCENRAPLHITMKGNAQIKQNGTGISEDVTSHRSYTSADRLKITMEGTSRISANETYGIALHGYGVSANPYQIITLKDSAVIGGSSAYIVADKEGTCGNGGSGIATCRATQIILQGDSAIRFNSGSGIEMNRPVSDYNEGKKAVTLEGDSSITDNGQYGIFAKADSYANPCVVTVQGNAVIQNNRRETPAGYQEIYLNKESELHLKDKAEVSHGAITNYAIWALGKIYMEGTVTVGGRIALETGTLPITLQTPVTDGKEYHLRIGEGFLGKEVVIPDGAVVIDASQYLPNYIKDEGTGLAVDKELVVDRPNIILQGENNVYLAGNGIDTNDGNSPATAVRTFRRAKELLETGYYTEGANILICNSAVVIISGDTVWSFDSDGTVTNTKTGARWTPLVQRYQAYKGRMITVSDSYPATFKNITIDGNGEQVTTGTHGEIIDINRGTVTLETGAILQNNRSSVGNSYASAAGVRVYGGTLNLVGGIIQDMKLITDNKDDSSNEFRPYGSAILSWFDNVSYPTTVHMKSGQIRNNTVEGSAPSNHMSGAAVAICADTKFIMDGGMISGNETISALPISNANHKIVSGGGLYVSNGLAEIRGGSIRDNSGNIGSAIYYLNTGARRDSRGVLLSGGQITGNRVNSSLGVKPLGEYAPIYVGGVNFQLQGGGCDVTDAMYLNDVENRIIVSGDIYQLGRQYQVSLNQGNAAHQYHKGSVVVSPDGNKKTDVSTYLPYFTVMSNPYVLDRGQSTRTIKYATGVLENQSLLLMQAVFVDGENGDDSNPGNTPRQAVRTFTRASTIGATGYGEQDMKDYYILYVCGKVTNTDAEPIWNMPAPAYICRYTGFSLYQPNGDPVNERNDPYYGYLIEPQHDLSLEQMAIYGRRTIDSISNNGDSLIRIPDGVTVTVLESAGQAAVFGRNYNVGEYNEPETGLPASLSRSGGAFKVTPGGTLIMEAGRIMETEAAFGGAIHLEAEKIVAGKTGRLLLRKTPSIAGTVYLSGTSADTAAFVEPEMDYIPPQPLNITIGNDYNGRQCIRYPALATPGEREMGYYSFEDSINALYEVGYRDGASNIIEINQKDAIYLDGVNGNDTNNGSTPEQAFQTLKQVYQSVADSQTTDGSSTGSVVYVVDTVTLNTGSAQNVELNNVQNRNPDTSEIQYEGYYRDASTPEILVKGQIYFKRYAQPSKYDDSNPIFAEYGKPTLLKELFVVKDGAKLSLWGIYLDGHSQASVNNNVLYTTEGVQAESPLITVKTGGKLESQFAESIGNTIATPSLFLNNVNTNRKTNKIGELDGSDIYEGSSAGIEILGGEVVLNHAEFRNLKLGDNVVSGGTDIYHNGTKLTFYNQALFSGSIFLEGQGMLHDIPSQDTSRYLSILKYGTPAKNDFQLLMRDPYKGRQVVFYIPEADGPPNSQIGVYRLEERVKEFFFLTKREDKPWILEIRIPIGVYIDGQKGSDDYGNAKAGSNPAYPVKTLKRAYELLRTRAGNTIHVVDTIEVDENMTITGTQYSGDVTVGLGSTDKVNITRYIQPDFAYQGTEPADEIANQGYHIPDFTGRLFHVRAGNRLSVATDVTLDGHSEEKTHPDYPKEVTVTRKTTSMTPLLDVSATAIVELLPGSILKDNNNQYVAGSGTTGLDGGAIHNRGTVTVTGALFANNHATKGDAAYQAGTFTIQSGITNLASHSFYLASANTGTAAAPNWADSVLQIAEAVPESQTLDLNMDHAVSGRDVIRFTDSQAYAPSFGADAEYERFALNSTVPEELFLVEADEDPSVLELQDWKILKVEVPANIYLAVTRKGTRAGSTKLNSIQTGTTDLFSAPVYQIDNHGRYDVNVSVNGVNNLNGDMGITDSPMILKERAADALGKHDVYLAIKGTDRDPDNGLTADETALQSGTVASFKLGRLQAGSSGTFEFVGKVGPGFVDEYKDSMFPLTESVSDVQKYINGTDASGIIHAQAKYLLKYKVEMVVPR